MKNSSNKVPKIHFSFVNNVSKIEVFLSIILSLNVFFYPFVVGNFFKIGIYPFIDRITFFKNFDYAVIDHNVDFMIIGSLFFLWVGLSINSKWSKITTILIFSGVITWMVLSGENSIFKIVSIFSLPVIIGLMLIHKFGKKILNRKPKYFLTTLHC